MLAPAFVPPALTTWPRTAAPHLQTAHQPVLHRPVRRRRVSCVESPANRADAPRARSPSPRTQSKPQAPPPPPPIPQPPPPNPRDNIAADVRATLAWVSVAAAAAGGVAYMRGWDRAAEFVTAYIVEYSLSVDNLFVFLLIFSYFRVGMAAQHRVLTYGIAGAMAMRGVLIFVGEALSERFTFVTVLFAGILLYSAANLLLNGGGDEDENLENNRIVRFSRSLLPFADHYDGDRFFTMQDGVRLATPLMLVLLCVELSDVVFALDSVPAVLGISDDSVVIYLSNVLAIMGLRNLFFVLSDAIGDLRFLQQSLGLVLGFVGAKMLAGVGGIEVGVLPSLGVIVGTLSGGVALSLAFPGGAEEGKGEG